MHHFGWLEVHAVDHCNNNCRWCHNYSPFSPKRDFEAREYYDGLDVLRKHNVNFFSISIMGGEPFLHPDLITFAYDLLVRYKHPLMLTTNGFWLSSDAIKAYKELWSLITTLRISRYPTIEKRLGGPDDMKRLIYSIKEYNPALNIDFPDKSFFNTLAFYDAPMDIQVYCGNSECTALLPDMRMGRCGAGAYMHLAPPNTFTDAFAASEHMFYDLKAFEPQSFWLWRKRYPLDACAYCSFSQKTKYGVWKLERGRPLFNVEHELAHDLNVGKRLLAKGHLPEARDRARLMRGRYGETVEVATLEGLVDMTTGNLDGALHAFSKVLELDPGNRLALNQVRSVRRYLVHGA